MHTIIGLLSGTHRRKSPIPRIRHDNEYPFRRIIPLQGKGTQQSMWTLFPGVGTKRWRAHSVKRRIPREHDNPMIRHCIQSGGGVRCTVSQLPNRYYFLTHIDRYGPLATKHTRTLQQCYSSRHCKHHHETSTLEIYGNEVLLGGG